MTPSSPLSDVSDVYYKSGLTDLNKIGMGARGLFVIRCEPELKSVVVQSGQCKFGAY